MRPLLMVSPAAPRLSPRPREVSSRMSPSEERIQADQLPGRADHFPDTRAGALPSSPDKDADQGHQNHAHQTGPQATKDHSPSSIFPRGIMPPSGLKLSCIVVGASRPVGRGDGRQHRATDAKARLFPSILPPGCPSVACWSTMPVWPRRGLPSCSAQPHSAKPAEKHHHDAEQQPPVARPTAHAAEGIR